MSDMEGSHSALVGIGYALYRPYLFVLRSSINRLANKVSYRGNCSRFLLSGDLNASISYTVQYMLLGVLQRLSLLRSGSLYEDGNVLLNNYTLKAC